MNVSLSVERILNTIFGMANAPTYEVIVVVWSVHNVKEFLVVEVLILTDSMVRPRPFPVKAEYQIFLCAVKDAPLLS